MLINKFVVGSIKLQIYLNKLSYPSFVTYSAFEIEP